MNVTATRGYSASKQQLLNRLARVEGQVRGVARMVDEDRYCIDVLTQISAITGRNRYGDCQRAGRTGGKPRRPALRVLLRGLPPALRR